MSKLSVGFILLGCAFGLMYCLLGVAASSHLKDRSEKASNGFLGAFFYWSFEPSRYGANGLKLCAWGNVSFAIATAAWIAGIFYK